jgi:hypothetical protein
MPLASTRTRSAARVQGWAPPAAALRQASSLLLLLTTLQACQVGLERYAHLQLLMLGLGSR